MKLLLQILWGWSVLANGAVGIQVGTVQTNNQNIKLMKMNFTSPVWLQSASNVGGGTPETRFVFVDGENQVRLSANGSVVIKSVQDGEIVLEEYSALNNTAVTINTEADTEVVIYGAVAEFSTYPQYPPRNVLKSLDVSKNTALTYLFCFGSTGLTSLDVSKNTALTYLNCSGTGLTSLDVSQNTALNSLDCSGCTGMMLLNIQNTTRLEFVELFSSTNTNLTTLQVAGTSAMAYEKVENWLNGDAPNGGTVLVDENTPQEVIDAATAKNWTVEYVDA